VKYREEIPVLFLFCPIMVGICSKALEKYESASLPISNFAKCGDFLLINLPPQQNLWVVFGSGRSPKA